MELRGPAGATRSTSSSGSSSRRIESARARTRTAESDRTRAGRVSRRATESGRAWAAAGRAAMATSAATAVVVMARRKLEEWTLGWVIIASGESGRVRDWPSVSDGAPATRHATARPHRAGPGIRRRPPPEARDAALEAPRGTTPAQGWRTRPRYPLDCENARPELRDPRRPCRLPGFGISRSRRVGHLPAARTHDPAGRCVVRARTRCWRDGRCRSHRPRLDRDLRARSRPAHWRRARRRRAERSCMSCAKRGTWVIPRFVRTSRRLDDSFLRAVRRPDSAGR